ncbi:MAG: pheSB, partial [Firmicutes bacterium]|nr:pheSB [Bacillota bacterium]
PVPTEAHSYDGWADVAWAAVEAAGDRLETVGEQVLVVVVPTRRLDVHEEIDLVEEVARSEGYDQIPELLPVLEASRGGRSPLAEEVLQARRALAAAGLDEVMTQSLTHPRVYDKLRLPEGSPERHYLSLANPLYEDRATLRTTILPGLLDTLHYNVNRQNRDLGVFEIASVYRPEEGGQLPAEPRMLGLAMMGNQAPAAWNSPTEPADYYSLVGVVANLMDAMNIADWHVEGTSEHPALHPGRQAQLWVGGAPVGSLGELHPAVQETWDLPSRVYVAELAFERLADAALPQREYGAVPRFPAVTRDVALVIEQDSPAARVAETIRGAGGDLVEDVTLFDLYEGEHVKPGHRSLAYRITYRAADRTLAEAEIEAVHGKVRTGLQDLGAELRS